MSQQNLTQEEIEYIKDYMTNYLSNICGINAYSSQDNKSYSIDNNTSDEKKTKLKKIAYAEMMFQLKGYKTPLFDYTEDFRNTFVVDKVNRNKVVDHLKIKWYSIEEILPIQQLESEKKNYDNKMLFDFEE